MVTTSQQKLAGLLLTENAELEPYCMNYQEMEIKISIYYNIIEAQSQHFQLFEYFRLFQTSSENTLKHDTTEFNKIQPVSHMAYSIRHNSARSYL